MKPISDHVILAPQNEAVTAGGILIPAAHQDDVANKENFIRNSNQFAKARVVAVHPGRKTKKGVRIPCAVEPGQWVIYRRAEAAPFELTDPETGGELVIIHEESVLGVVGENVRVDRNVGADGGIVP